ncbi:MAG: KEOPS complex kinase/ATPase Bud32 [Nanoarchaeota archaeon]
MKKVSFGAEAEIYVQQGQILKKRVRKGYRHAEIDVKLRKSRNQREYRLLEKLSAKGFPVPRPLRHSATAFSMQRIAGKKVRDILDGKNVKGLCPQIGKLVALLHNQGIIHGDLTTSNMILSKGKVFLIDFGLSFYSQRVEDKAVDLHLLKQALTSRHWRIAERAFAGVMASYRKEAKDATQVLARLQVVEGRGRYKGKEKSGLQKNP